MLLIFSTSLVGYGSVIVCGGPFVWVLLNQCGTSFGQVRVLFVGIYSFLVLVCREWGELLEPETMYSIMAWRFPVLIPF